MAKTNARFLEKQEQDRLDNEQLEQSIKASEKLKQQEQAKQLERRKNGEVLLRDAEALYQRRQKSSNGASRGMNMTREEVRYNKGILKEVARMKKEGQFEGLFEKCADNKVTGTHP